MRTLRKIFTQRTHRKQTALVKLLQVFCLRCVWLQNTLIALAYRPLRRSEHRKSLTSLKLVVDTPLRQLTVTLTLALPALTINTSHAISVTGNKHSK